MRKIDRRAALLVALACAAAPAWPQEGRTSDAGGPGSTDRPQEAEQVAPELREFLAEAERVLAGTNNQFLGPSYVADLERKLAATTPGTEEDVPIRVELANAYLRDGEIDTAIALLDAALGPGEPPAGGARIPGAADLYRVRALAYLRKAEVQNCVDLHNRECCIFPLAGGGLHTVDAPARAAKRDYMAHLALLAGTDHERAKLSAMWLLQISCMALGEDPADLPEAYRLPPFVAESKRDLGRFVDVAPAVGVDAFDLAGGAVVDDLDGDGRLDIVTSTCDPRGAMKASRNRGDGSFEDVARAWKVDRQLGGLQITAADYDNDGRLDLFVPRGAWLYGHGHIRRSLLHNEPGGFVDVTRAAGLAEFSEPSQVGVWADFDNDGWLDVYTASESSGQIEKGAPDLPSLLFRSNGDGTFTDVAREAGVTNERFAKGACAGDYDNDGDMDLFVSNYGRDRLYRNELSDGKGLRFVDVADAAGLDGPLKSFACWFFDYDQDGDLDLWVGAYEARAADIVKSMTGTSSPERAMFLYRNRSDGTFENVAQEVGLEKAWLPMGASFGDLDNDGWLDVYLGTGDPNYETIVPNVALRNDGGRRFEEVTRSTGLGHLQKGHGVVFADLDDDGDQDIYHQLGGFFGGDAYRNALFLNPGHGKHWLKIELVGVETNRQGIGARLEIDLETPGGPRTLHRAVGSVSSFGNAPRRQEIGLGDASSIREVRVWWPTSGRRQAFAGLQLDSFVRLTEGKSELEVVPLHPVELRRDRP